MQQFDLSLWLKNKSRKVVTRGGRNVRIVCWDRQYAHNDFPIIALEEWDNGEFVNFVSSNGKVDLSGSENIHDLFFADEEPETIEVPFGAKDSEFIKDEYFIPEGCEARIEGNKVIIEKTQKEELTEFEKAIYQHICIIVTACDGEVYGDKELKPIVKEIAKDLLDLARKELEANYYTKVIDDRMVFKSDLHDRDMQGAYELGKQDALKDLPKWKKVDSNPPKVQYNLQGKRLYKNGEYYIELSDLETLPKEE